MKATLVSGRERPVPGPGFDAGEPGTVTVELTVVFDPRGGNTTRVTSCGVTRVDLADRRPGDSGVGPDR